MAENDYRSVNGRKAAGVPKKFSAEEIEIRKARLESARLRAVAVIRSKAEARKRKLEEHKRFVETMAQLGIFVPIQPFE